jgi:hypothetical protein
MNGNIFIILNLLEGTKMENVNTINKEVNVVAYYFHSKGMRLRCFPKVMEYNGRRIAFTETGLRHPARKGMRSIHVFDMTDGNADYRIEFDAHQLIWTLISITDTSFDPEPVGISRRTLKSEFAAN